MQKYEAIENGIANNDIKALREAIGSIIYTNRDFSNGEFFEVIKYVESKGIKIKDSELVGTPTITSQKNDYTDEDFAKAIFQLKKNFCDERINDVKTIGEKLYGKNKSKPSKTMQKTESVKVEVHNNNEKAGMDPNLKSHQQKVNPVVVLGLVAVVVIIVLVCLLVLK